MVIGLSLLQFAAPTVDACTRIFWNTNPDLMIVGYNEDYVTASHPTFVATKGMPIKPGRVPVFSWVLSDGCGW